MRYLEKMIAREKENLRIHEFAFMKAREVIFSQEVRTLCEKNACGMYGTSWACPPAVGSFEACQKRCNVYEHAFLFSSVASLKRKYDRAGWYESRLVHESITEKTAEIFRAEFPQALILSTEGCTLCSRCTYPENPCRFPQRMFPAVESYGIMVLQQAPYCHLQYNNGPNTVTYFSLIFF